METFWKRDDEGSLSFPGGNGGYEVFVETGTQACRTLLRAAAAFPLCRSVDIDPDALSRAGTLFWNHPGVERWGGNSGEAIWEMIADLEDKKVCFWLDAHATDDSIQTNQCPLLEELKAIAHQDWKHTPLILIDDAPCFGASEPMFKGHDPKQWPGLVEIIFVLGPRWHVGVEGKVIVCSPMRNSSAA